MVGNTALESTISRINLSPENGLFPDIESGCKEFSDIKLNLVLIVFTGV